MYKNNKPGQGRIAQKTRVIDQNREQPLEDSVKMYLRAVSEVPNLPYQEEKRLFKNMNLEARQKLINANLKLVPNIVRGYANNRYFLLDLIAEGNQGLIKAIEKYNYNPKYKFQSYAIWHIRQAITRALAEQEKTIRIPRNFVDDINKIRKITERLTGDYRRNPTHEEIARSAQFPVQKVKEILKTAMDPISLETPIGEQDSLLGDFPEQRQAQTPMDNAYQSSLKVGVKDVLDFLTERQANILKYRVGLEDGTQHSLEEVCKQFGVTTKEIIGIEAKATLRLRHSSRIREIREYPLD